MPHEVEQFSMQCALHTCNHQRPPPGFARHMRSSLPFLGDENTTGEHIMAYIHMLYYSFIHVLA